MQCRSFAEIRLLLSFDQIYYECRVGRGHQELLEDLKTVGLKSIKVASGDSFFISNRPGVEVKNEIAFNAWAIKEKLVKPDTERIKAFLKGLVDRKVKLPPCVEFTNRDSISIRKAAKE